MRRWILAVSAALIIIASSAPSFAGKKERDECLIKCGNKAKECLAELKSDLKACLRQ
jgi:hypothetical protein